MNPPPLNTPRGVPRFLPTLTEVVDPSTLVVPEVVATPDLEDAVWFVMQRVDMLIERRVREETHDMLGALITQQLQVVGEQLRLELEPVVRQAVADALALQSETHKHK